VSRGGLLRVRGCRALGAISVHQPVAFVPTPYRKECGMRYLRTVLVSAIAMGAFVVPSSAAAQITSISIGRTQLGPQGASLTVPVRVQCDLGWTLNFVNVSVAQRSGRFLAQGFGSASWGAPCFGPGTIIIPVTNGSFIAFHRGEAAATADVTVTDQNFNFFSKSVSQSIRVTRNPVSYVDPLSHHAVRRSVHLK
jgi:hypothetical protein